MASTPLQPLKLAAFADEISPQLDEQIAVCRQLGIGHVELRGVYGKNVLDFDAPLRKEIKSKFADAGLGVAAIGSPIGKVKITDDWSAHFDRFKIAVEAAEFFNAPMIRVFSYYPADGQSHDEFIVQHEDEVIRRFQQKVEYLKGRNVVMVHENEARIYGEKGRECERLMKAIGSPKLRTAFDFANFVQAGENPWNNWPGLKTWTIHIHIKDARLGSGAITPAGEGDGDIEPILRDAWQSGYQGFLSLEPHLAAHGQFSGFSGPDLFKTATLALRAVAQRAGVSVTGVTQ
jgi:sugar phosphate isomerase/epimerase